MNNPTMLYRCPGSEEFEGVKCETTVVDEADVAAHKEAGWHSDWMQADAAYRKTIAGAVKANEAEMADIEKKLEGTKTRKAKAG